MLRSAALSLYVFRFSFTYSLVSRDNENTSGSWANYLTSTITSSASALIPFSGSLNAWRNFATARLQEGGLCTTAGIVTLKNVPYILVVNSNAELQVFKLDVENGGECELISTQRFVVLTFF